MNWYSFKPSDTLFFRGSEPLEKGVSHHASVLFPPPVQTISGALRTACLQQRSIKIEDYYEENIPEYLLSAIGKAGSNAPYSITGPLLKKDHDYYIPAPYSWFYNKADEDKERIEESVVFTNKIYTAKKIHSNLIKTPSELQWIKSEHTELASAGGRWIAIKDLYGKLTGVKLFSATNFYAMEERTGIALEKRTVREGHLYTMNHIRLKESVEIIFAVDKDLPLNDKGPLKLGGEQRFGLYKKIETVLELNRPGSIYLSLSPIETGSNSKNLVATGKIQYIGGWDMKKRFHKDMVGYYPAGTVFNQKINDNCISLMEAN